MGFSIVMEKIIETFTKKQKYCMVGHNPAYDLIYIYNQFVKQLPDSYAEFAQNWHSNFPNTFDTKVLSFQSDYFGKTSLGKVFEKCDYDKRLKDILKFSFDPQFPNYNGANLSSHYHEAGYDAFMTGVIFAKILKYKQIDE